MTIHLVVAIGWGAWVMALLLFLAVQYRVARDRRSAVAERVDALSAASVKRFTQADVRMLMNGDRRDALEIHQDCMGRAYTLAIFLAVAGLLYVLGLFR